MASLLQARLMERRIVTTPVVEFSIFEHLLGPGSEGGMSLTLASRVKLMTVLLSDAKSEGVSD